MKKTLGYIMFICLAFGTVQGQTYKKAIAFDYNPFHEQIYVYYDDNSGGIYYSGEVSSSLDFEISYRFQPRLSASIQAGWTRDYHRYWYKSRDSSDYGEDFSGFDMTQSLSTIRLVA